MHLDNLISDLALILIVAAFVTIVFKKLKLPVVLGYIAAGFLISPNFSYLPTVVEEADIHVWANIGIVFLMFGLGLEFSFKKLATVGGSAFVIAITVMGAMTGIGATTGHLMGWSRMDCIFLGCMLSMSSTMIILKAYEEYGLKNKKFAQLVLGTLVIEDIAGIFMMIVLATISVSKNASGWNTVSEIGFLMICLVIWLVLGIYLIPTILNLVKKQLNDELLLILAVAICLGMVVIANYLGFSSALGAFMAGSILAGTVQSVKIEHLVTPLKDLFGAIFFVSVGMLIVPELLVEYIVPIIIITLVTIAGQMTFATIGILLSGQSLNTAIRGGFSMVQIGEFSFIVASLGMSLGVINDFLYPIVVCVSVITSFTTPIFIKNSEYVYEFLDRKLPKSIKIFLRKNTSDNKSKEDKDQDWYIYIRKVAVRTVLCSLIMFLLYWAGTRYLTSFIIEHIGSQLCGRVISVIATCVCMIPFVVFMHGTNETLFTKLWLKHRANRLPLLTLKGIRIVIASCFIALVLRTLLHAPYIILVWLVVIPVIFLIRSDYLRGITINMEMRFMANFSERTLAREKKERGLSGDYHWLNEALFVTEFQVTDTGDNKTIRDFTHRKAFRLTIIRIIRDGRTINLPSGNEVVCEGDILHMLGTKDEIDACTLLLESEECIEYTDRDDIMLKDYIYAQVFYGINKETQLMCCPILVDQHSPFARKSIKHSRMREKYRGTIIGIERGNLPMISPGKETIIMPGDLVWVLGSKQMADSLIRNDMLYK